MVGDEFVDAGVAEYMEEAVWIDMYGCVVDEVNAFDCKVNVDITDPS